MTEMGSTTVYIPDNAKPTTASSYAAFLNENNLYLLRSKQENSGPLLRGPRRVLRLCLFGLILPTVLITVPLYVRLVLYPPGHYPMMPTDQRVLSRHVSSIWCQAQSTRMNGSFNTYQAPKMPPLKEGLERHEMIYSTVLSDDIKEYWGFHLLKGSKVTISTCSSRNGAQLMILRGIENLKRCAWIGEEDSREEIEGWGGGDATRGNDKYKSTIMKVVTSTLPPDIREEEGLKGGEMGNEYEYGQLLPNLEETDRWLNVSEGLTAENASEERRQHLQDLIRRAMKMSKSKKEILRILHAVGRDSKKSLPKNIRQIMGIPDDEVFSTRATEKVPLVKKKIPTNDTRIYNNTRSTDDEVISTRATERVPLVKKKIPTNDTEIYNNTQSTGEPEPLRRRRSILLDEEEYDDGAFEEFDDDDEISVTSKNRYQNTKSTHREEHVLGHIFYPEGLKLERGKFNQTDRADRSNEEDHSSYSSSEEALENCEGVILTLPLEFYRSCSYKWVEMNKISYDIPVDGTYYFVYSSDNEIDSNTIYLNMTFEKVVYDVDSSLVVCSNATHCSVPLSFWSSEEVVVEVPQENTWSHSYTLDTTCDPRVAVYLTFLLLVPILILFCAFQ